MEKGLLVFFGLMALASAATIFVDEIEPTIPAVTTPATVPTTAAVPTVAPQKCLSETGPWSGDDIRVFYFCINGQVVTVQCDEDQYYVNNATASGCIPEELMNPSCVNSEVVLEPCTGDNLLQPQASSDLGKFYLCPSEGATPVLLTCPGNKAFIKQDKYLGCFDWSMWHDLRSCPENDLI